VEKKLGSNRSLRVGWPGAEKTPNSRVPKVRYPPNLAESIREIKTPCHFYVHDCYWSYLIVQFYVHDCYWSLGYTSEKEKTKSSAE